MSTYTPNLGLFKYNLSTDGKESFDINRCLNDNWDRLDQSYSSLNSSLYNKMDKVTDVGNTSKPVYVNSEGKINACSDSLGNSITPVYISEGQFYQCSRSIPSSSTSGLTATVSLAENGYIKFSNKFLINWGTSASSGKSTVYFASSFTSTNYQVSINGGYNSLGNPTEADISPVFGSKTTSNMVVYVNKGNFKSWIAVGY